MSYNRRYQQRSQECPGGKIPAKWIGCPKICERLIGDKFVVFKTPLSNNFAHKIKNRLEIINEKLTKNGDNPLLVEDGQTQDFSISDILEGFSKLEISAEAPSPAKEMRSVKTWIDLTNTDRYFDPSEVKRAGITYHKLPIFSSKKAVPDNIVQKFIRICKGSKGLVGVHCTHGYNRTGYLICSYLVEVKGLSIDEAIADFRENRPPGIYKAVLLEALVEKYGGREESAIPPPTPLWVEIENMRAKKRDPETKPEVALKDFKEEVKKAQKIQK